MLLALFFAFVGWNKAFASLSVLAQHHAWTVFLPEWLGRLVGWSEMILAAFLLSVLVPRRSRMTAIAAMALVANQLAAAAVHLTYGETGALPQNAVLIALLGLIAYQTRETVR
ncbi:MAG: DoxX family protein [Sphingomonadales bacterium]|nr:DoxX family protein [Sphingomonadales bacterium]